jgi:transposase
LQFRSWTDGGGKLPDPLDPVSAGQNCHREEAIRRLQLGASLADVARACEVNPNVLHRWRREVRDYGAKAFAVNGERRGEEAKIAELERKVGRQILEIDFLRRCLQRVEEQRKLQALTSPRWSTNGSKKK